MVQSPYWFATRDDLAFGADLPHLYTGGVRKFFETIEGHAPLPKLREIHGVGRQTSDPHPSGSKYYYVVCEANGRSTYQIPLLRWNAKIGGIFRIDPDSEAAPRTVDPHCIVMVGRQFYYFQTDVRGYRTRKSLKTILHIVEANQMVQLRTIRQITGIGLYKPQP
jgi:hypothetical protein